MLCKGWLAATNEQQLPAGRHAWCCPPQSVRPTPAQCFAFATTAGQGVLRAAVQQDPGGPCVCGRLCVCQGGGQATSPATLWLQDPLAALQRCSAASCSPAGTLATPVFPIASLPRCAWAPTQPRRPTSHPLRRWLCAPWWPTRGAQHACNTWPWLHLGPAAQRALLVLP